MKKDETTKKQTNNEDVRKDLAEIKITIAILQEQVKKLAAVLNVVQPAMYTEEEYREMAEYRRRKKWPEANGWLRTLRTSRSTNVSGA